MQTNATIHDKRIKIFDISLSLTRLQTADPPLIVKNNRNFHRVKKVMYSVFHFIVIHYTFFLMSSSFFFCSYKTHKDEWGIVQNDFEQAVD